MKLLNGSIVRTFVGAAMLAATLAIPQITPVGVAHAVGMAWSQSGPSLTRLVGVAASSDATIAYATENPTNALRKIWKTTDAGATWEVLPNAPSKAWGAIATSGDGTIVVALAWSGSDQLIYRSIDSGNTWTLDLTSTQQLFDIAITNDGNTVVVGSAAGILKSIDGGASYNPTANPLANTQFSTYNDWRSIDISADGMKIVAVSPYRSIQKSTDGGISWTELTNSGARYWGDIAISTDGLTIMGVARDENQGVWISRDGGQTFTAANIDTVFQPGQAVFGSMSDDGEVMIASSYYSSPYMSMDHGQTWSSINSASDGWLGFAVSATAIPQRRIIAVTENHGVYRYGPIPAPTITLVAPDAGSTVGGRVVNIFGQNFSNVTGVAFSGTPATSFEVVDSTMISVIAPPHSAGDTNITVTTESDTSQSVATYTYQLPVQPTVTAIAPTTGPPEGGTLVTLTGTEFRDIISVTIGGVLAIDEYVTSDTTLNFTVPAGNVGTVDVVLTTEGGTATLSNAFTYDASLTPENIDWSGLSSSSTDGDIQGWIRDVGQDSSGNFYVGGVFVDAGNEPTADAVAKWNGTSWVGLGSNGAGDGALGCLNDACSFNDLLVTSDGDVYAAGNFQLAGTSDAQTIVHWNGTSWSGIANADEGLVNKIALDSHNNLVAVGEFSNLGGDPTADNVAIWDGSRWNGLGSNGSGDGSFDGYMYSLAIGSDDSIYVSGDFTDAGGVAGADYLARWNGSNWEALGTYEINGEKLYASAYALTIDTSTGSDVLYIAGCMGWGEKALVAAKWDGTTWSALDDGSNFDGCAFDVAIAPTGAVVVAGYFSSGSENLSSGLATWDAGSWHLLGTNNQNFIYSVIVTSDSRLLVSGPFQNLGDSVTADLVALSQPVARLRDVGTSATVTPNVGPELGGTTVTITGDHFSQATQIKFGSAVATDLTVISENTISLVTPAHAPGAVDVHMISPSGDRVLAGAFTYVEPVSAVVDTEEEVLLLPEMQMTPRVQFVAGDSQTISVPGFVPGEHVQLLLASTPRLLASTTADANGVATLTFVFPRDVNGFHTLAIFAPVSARGMRQAIFLHAVGTVIGLDSLPKTGASIHLWLPCVIAMLGLLLAAISGNRRRKIA